jgi:hypothetical protein
MADTSRTPTIGSLILVGNASSPRVTAPCTIRTGKGKTIQHTQSPHFSSGERIVVFGNINDVARIPCNSLFRGGFSLGPTVQAGPHGSITIQMTNDPADEALLAANEYKIAWHLPASLLAGEMTALEPYVFSVMKVTFNSDRGRCTICGM